MVGSHGGLPWFPAKPTPYMKSTTARGTARATWLEQKTQHPPVVGYDDSSFMGEQLHDATTTNPNGRNHDRLLSRPQGRFLWSFLGYNNVRRQELEKGYDGPLLRRHRTTAAVSHRQQLSSTAATLAEAEKEEK
ncbi:unnamed protein product [Lactuca saligna]|uniref:Uncharacterized protein n=1 Tax=Lactuca saligna TaxID=75948 RepID=A0AA35Z264_LACSI|nr:unnamed protein product [Lactuca saligna]